MARESDSVILIGKMKMADLKRRWRLRNKAKEVPLSYLIELISAVEFCF